MILAGTGRFEITPENSQFLFGYPHVERFSTGVHDPIYSTALCLDDGKEKVLFISNDIIFVSKSSAKIVRKEISGKTGIPERNILVSATHTHSGPMTMDYVSNENDPVVPKADTEYVKFMEERTISAGLEAVSSLTESEIGLGIADGTGVGTNRRDPAGLADMDVPVLAIRKAGEEKISAVLLVCSMHPTVLHEDSKLISSDFPGMAKQYLNGVLGEDCTVLYHTGCEGNQSPRHVTKGNNFAEAERLGTIVGKAVEKVLPGIEFITGIELSVHTRLLEEVPSRRFPEVEDSEKRLKAAVDKLERLRTEGASSQEVRTAECDWFGAEETLTLSKAQNSGKIDEARKLCLPLEIQVLKLGNWAFVGWPGEMFIEFGLGVRNEFENTFIINLANGELQGYVVTEEAAEEGGYEASNGLFSPKTGSLIVEETTKLLDQAGVPHRADKKVK